MVCNPLKVWHDMGEPSSLSKNQKMLLKEGTRPLLATDRMIVKDGYLPIKLDINKNGVVYFEVHPTNNISDRGYSYERVIY